MVKKEFPGCRAFRETANASEDDDNTPSNTDNRQGFELWRSIKRIVCLNVNIRAPGLLGRLQAEMRNGAISDEMWDLYMSRVITPNDPRLHDEASPFTSTNPILLVHRHSTRVFHSFENARAMSYKLRTPLFIVQANDAVTRADKAHLFTDAVQAELLRKHNPKTTKGIPAFLPLFRGQRLLLSTKDA